MAQNTVKVLYDLSDLRKQFDIWQDYMKNEFHEKPCKTSDNVLIGMAIDFYTKDMEGLNNRNLEYIEEQRTLAEQNLNKALALNGKYITLEQLVEIEVLPEFDHLTNCKLLNCHIDSQWFILEFSTGQSIDVYIRNEAI